MKKFAKMSLVAAIAVAGTVASAQPLAEAIKNVDVSGTVVYRYNDYEGQPGVPATTNNYKAALTLKSKVNDDVTLNTRIVATNHAQSSFTSLNTTTSGDANVGINLSQVNFAYTGIANTTVVVGKQGLATPWTNAIDSDGSEQTGTGILAMTTVGPVTAAAGYINQHNITSAMAVDAFGDDIGAFANAGALTDAYIGSQGLAVAALLGSVGPVNLEAWYLDHADVFDSVFLKASASFDLDAVKLGLFAQMTDSNLDSQVIANGEKNDYGLIKAGISAKMGIFGASYTYGQTGDSGSGVLNSVAKNGMIAWGVSLHDEEDAKMHLVTVDAQVLPSLNAAIKYAQVDRDTENGVAVAANADTEEETYLQLSYNMSKNLSSYLRIGEYEDGTDEKEDRARVQVQYSF